MALWLALVVFREKTAARRFSLVVAARPVFPDAAYRARCNVFAARRERHARDSDYGLFTACSRPVRGM